MHGLPLFIQQYEFTTTGYNNVFTAELPAIPLLPIPNKWSLQVTGIDASGAVAAPSAWTVTAQASLDGLGYDDDTGAMLTHVNTANANGAVVKSNGNLMIARFVRLHCVALTLGASAVKIRVTLMGHA